MYCQRLTLQPLTRNDLNAVYADSNFGTAEVDFLEAVPVRGSVLKGLFQRIGLNNHCQCRFDVHFRRRKSLERLLGIFHSAFAY